MNVRLNLTSAAFWSALAGAAGIILGTLGVGQLSTPVETAVTAIGGVLVALASHHVTAAQQARKTQ